MSHIRSMADRLSGAATSNDVWKTALQFLPELGLSKVIFLDLANPAEPRIQSNASTCWTADYKATIKAGLDPFPLNCLSRIDPMLTGIGHLEELDYLGDEALDQVAQGSEALGIRTGMSVTISPNATGAGMGFNLMTNHSVIEFSELRAQHEVHWRAWCQLTSAGLSKKRATCTAPSLTVRERDCLALIADGLRTADVGHRLGISEGTVEMHTRNARTRLGAQTRDQAVAIAVRAGMI